jgi:hypothetical protein
MIAILLSSRDFRTRDIYIDYPYEDAKFRFERDTGKVYRRWYGKGEVEIPHSSDLFNQAISAGKEITREDYFCD